MQTAHAVFVSITTKYLFVLVCNKLIVEVTEQHSKGLDICDSYMKSYLIPLGTQKGTKNRIF